MQFLNRVQLLLICIFLICVGCSHAQILESGYKHKIHLIWMGGNDCPPCVDWRRTQLPLLQSAPEFAQIRFSYVSKSVHSSVPSSFFLPEEVKPYKEMLDEASGGMGGSPQFAILVDGQLYDYQFGTKPAPTLLEMIRYIETGYGSAPYQRCLRRKTGQMRKCEKYGA
jgi:hypothetical protein